PGGAGFNEWRFDDTKGKEEIFTHAERNMDTRVKNDCMELILHDRHLIVGTEKDGEKVGNQQEQVFQDKHLNVKRHQHEHVEGNELVTIGHGETKEGGNLDVKIQRTKKETVGTDDHLHVGGSQRIAVDGKQDLTVKDDKKELLKANSHLHVTSNRNEKIDG